MIRDRSSVVVAATLLAVLLLVSPLQAAKAPETPALAGTTKDTIGRVLENVEVLLLASGARHEPTAVTRTGADGGFSFTGLAPGVYKIAVVKEGYLTFVDRVDTGLRRWLDIVLHPSPAFGEEPGSAIAEDAGWVLRLPDRNVLRQSDPETPVVDDSTDEAPSHHEPLTVEIGQMLAMRTDLRSTGRGSMTGTETRLRVASPLGTSGDLTVEGVHESLGASTEGQDSSARDASSMNMAFSYDTGVDSRVRVKAFLDQRGLTWEAPGSLLGQRRKERIWGWGAEWNKQLGSRSDVAVRLDYRDAYLTMPDYILAPSGIGFLDDVDPNAGHLANRTVAAAAQYRNRLSRRHEIRAGFQARMREDPRAVFDPAVTGGPAEMDVEIDVEDTWAVGGPFSVIYGFGYRHALKTREASYLFPHVGASWENDKAALSVVVSYHAPAHSEARVTAAGLSSENTLGYEVELRLARLGAVSIFGSSSFAPVEMDLLSGRSGFSVFGGDPTLLSDGRALLHRHRLALVADAGSARTFVELSRGRAEGQLTLFHAFDLPLSGSSDRLLRYNTARVGLKVVPSGTELVLGYEQLTRSDSTSVMAVGESQQRTVKLGLAQDLMRMENVGNWRLLMALRMISLDADGEFGGIEDEEGFLLASPTGEVSAGVSVMF